MYHGCPPSSPELSYARIAADAKNGLKVSAAASSKNGFAHERRKRVRNLSKFRTKPEPHHLRLVYLGGLYVDGAILVVRIENFLNHLGAALCLVEYCRHLRVTYLQLILQSLHPVAPISGC